MLDFLRQSARRLRGSLSFRLTLNYGLLSVLTTLILISFIHAQVIGALRTEYTRQITATAQRLTLIFEEQGRAGLVAAIELTLSDRIDTDRDIYLLLDAEQRKLAGNIDALPALDWQPDHDHGQSSAERDAAAAVFNTRVIRQSTSHSDTDPDHDNGQSSAERGYVKIQPLADGATLVVGHNAREMADMTALIQQATLATAFLAVLLVLLGAHLFRNTLDYRVGQIRRTTQQISAGQLSRRVPAAVEDDEFTLLTRDINTMLDRIEVLMKSARHISDTIAHNLRTPLTHISAALQAAQRGADGYDADAPALRRACQSAIDGIANLSLLLEKLLRIAEMDAGIQRRAFKPCDLARIVADVVEMYDALAEEQGVAVVWEGSRTVERASHPPVVVHGDANLLASALANLLDNAVKHARTRVTVAVTRRGEYGCVVIADDGAGLPPEAREHLGHHFYRVNADAPGHGLGLTSVRSIVALHRGTLAFDSAEAGGLQASVTVPCV